MPARFHHVLLALLLTLSAARASAQEPLRLSASLLLSSTVVHPAAFHLRDVVPHTAQDKRLAGWILVGAGIVHLALTPVCFSELHGHGEEAVCVGATAVLGSAAVVVGAVFLVQGYQHAAPHARPHKPHARLEPKLDLALARGGAVMSYRVRW